MDMLGVEGMNMLEEHDRPSNHWLEEEGMDMADIHMVEVEVMDMVEERPLKERPEVEGINTEEEHSSKERPKVEGMDMVEDMTTEVVEREHEDVGLARHWIGEGAESVDELIGNGRSLRSQGVEKVTPRLEVKTLVVEHRVEWRKEWK
jgi:hypothetical protein